MNQRTIKQNSNYWAWITELAREMNDKGIDLNEVLTVPIMPTGEILHEVITKKLIKSIYGKKSTTELDTKELSEVVDIIRNAISERTKGEINLPFNENTKENI